jgi:ABC-type lipoprotein release transport system permease subunit
VLSGLLTEVSPTDPATYVAVTGLLLLVTLLASFGPAWRASRVAPLEALRHE